jgi:deoxyadenosine/deoxycytidine kinase
VEVLLDRIDRRGVDYESMIDRDYLQALVDAYTQFFYHYTAAPLLVVNATEINFVDNQEDFQTLLDHINTVHSGRHFFNPLSAEL